MPEVAEKAEREIAEYLERMGPKTKRQMGGKDRIISMLDSIRPILSLQNLRAISGLSEMDDDFGATYAGLLEHKGLPLGYLPILQNPKIVRAASENKGAVLDLFDAISAYCKKGGEYKTAINKAKALGLTD